MLNPINPTPNSKNKLSKNFELAKEEIDITSPTPISADQHPNYNNPQDQDKYGRNNVFQLRKMAILTKATPKLFSIYKNLFYKYKEYLGYHYNEILMARIFIDYVMPDEEMYNRYRNTRVTGNEPTRILDEKLDNEMKEKEMDETTTSASSGSYSTPFIWSKTGKPTTKPMFPKNMIGNVVVEDFYSMKNAFNLLNEEKSDDPCWKGYKQYGMKDKDGKQVPNCIKEEDCNECGDTNEDVYPRNTVHDDYTNKEIISDEELYENYINKFIDEALSTKDDIESKVLSTLKANNIEPMLIPKLTQGIVSFIVDGDIEYFVDMLKGVKSESEIQSLTVMGLLQEVMASMGANDEIVPDLLKNIGVDEININKKVGQYSKSKESGLILDSLIKEEKTKPETILKKVHNDNAKNQKSDFKMSSLYKELDLDKDESFQDFEKMFDYDKDKLKDDEIKKYPETDKQKKTVIDNNADYRLGMQHLRYDNEPTKDFTDRLNKNIEKTGETVKQVQDKIKQVANHRQSTNFFRGKYDESKNITIKYFDKKTLVNEYVDISPKNFIFVESLNDLKDIEKCNIEYMDFKYLQENDIVSKNTFYLDNKNKKVYVLENKKTINGMSDKEKHLMNYNPKKFMFPHKKRL